MRQEGVCSAYVLFICRLCSYSRLFALLLSICGFVALYPICLLMLLSNCSLMSVLHLLLFLWLPSLCSLLSSFCSTSRIFALFIFFCRLSSLYLSPTNIYHYTYKNHRPYISRTPVLHITSTLQYITFTAPIPLSLASAALNASGR